MPTPAKAMIFALILTSLLSVYLSGDSPMTSTEASPEKIEILTSSSEQTNGLDIPKTESSTSPDITTDKPVAADPPQKGASDQNPKTNGLDIPKTESSSSSDITTDKPVAADPPQKGASDQNPKTNGLDISKTESSSSPDITSDKPVAADPLQKGANDQNPKVIEAKDSWTYSYSYTAIAVGVITCLCCMGILYYTTIWPRFRTVTCRLNPFAKK